MKKKKLIDKDLEHIKKQLEDFQQLINPKPSKEEREILKRKYLENRGE